MDSDFESRSRLSRKGSSTLIELDIAYCTDRRMSRGHNSTMMSRNELSDLGETLEHLTAEHGKSLMIPVDEGGCPDMPKNFRVFRNPYLKTMCNLYRESITPESYSYVLINFRTMRRNASMYVGYLLSQKGIRRKDLYMAKYLPIWTLCIRLKVRVNVKVGLVFHGLKSRLGVTSLNGLHFCIDGFYGLEAFGDAFGNTGVGICPWMELGGNGTAKSLRLRDGDNIYISTATESMQQAVQQRRMAVNGFRPMVQAMHMDNLLDNQDDSKPVLQEQHELMQQDQHELMHADMETHHLTTTTTTAG